MTKLPGDRPERRRDFHDKDGNHTHPHPRTYTTRKQDWDAWETRYAAHLDRHAELIENPEPMEGDDEAVQTLFQHIEVMEGIIAKEKLLIKALRQRAALHPEADELELPGLSKLMRQTGGAS